MRPCLQSWFCAWSRKWRECKAHASSSYMPTSQPGEYKKLAKRDSSSTVTQSQVKTHGSANAGIVQVNKIREHDSSSRWRCLVSKICSQKRGRARQSCNGFARKCLMNRQILMIIL